MPAPDPFPDPTAAEKTAALLRALWERNLPQLRERLALLDRAAAQAKAGALDDPTRLEAAAIAHKLAGSLGMFGYRQGTDLARTLETLLREAAPKAIAAKAPVLTKNLRSTLSL